MNMQIQKQHLSSSAAVNLPMGNVAIDPIFAIIDEHKSASRAFANFLLEKTEFDEGRRSGEGLERHPDCEEFDEREEELCDAEREVAAELAEAVPTTREGVLFKLKYVVAEHARGNRLYVDEELIAVIQSVINSNVLEGALPRRTKRRNHESVSVLNSCPVYPLAKEFGRLVEKYNQLDVEDTARRHDNNRKDNSWLKMAVWDRMSAIYDHASYLQSTSVIGAAFQAMIVNSHLDDLSDSDGNEQRELKARLERLLYRAVRNLVSADDISRAQRYLMSRHLDPFVLLDPISAA